jgi:hypothetical protein
MSQENNNEEADAYSLKSWSWIEHGYNTNNAEETLNLITQKEICILGREILTPIK